MELRNIGESRNIVEKVKKDSIAAEVGVEEGDVLISINGTKVKDIIDYKYLITDEYIEMTIEKKNGEIWDLEIEKEYDEDMGIAFTNSLIDKAKTCKNKCLFCFIDQLPKGMRETLYFKDDDSRLSFLQGNFITLTNMDEYEINRIIKYRISPINISVHTTDSDLRIKMLRNKNAGKLYDILKRFNAADIEMNCQIVLVPGVNDGQHLEKTLSDLSELYPNVGSVAVVPIGVTKFREGLFKATTYDYKLSKELLDSIHEQQKLFLEKLGSRFIFAADEFYVLAKKEIPSYEEYEGFPQYENGIGMVRTFKYEIENALSTIGENAKLEKDYIIATGTLAYDFMVEISELIMSRIEGLNLRVMPIVNNVFGETITVSGLVTGKDLLNKLKQMEIRDGVIIPRAMLKNDEEDIFLDDVTIEQLQKILDNKVMISDVDGKFFVDIFKKQMR